MEKQAKTDNGIIVVKPSDPQLLRLKRGIDFWAVDIEQTKIFSALTRFSETTEIYTNNIINLKISMDPFKKRLSDIGTFMLILIQVDFLLLLLYLL